MKARSWLWIVGVVALGAGYVLIFTDWVNPAPIEITAQIRGGRGGGLGPGGRPGRGGQGGQAGPDAGDGAGGRNRRNGGTGVGGRNGGGFNRGQAASAPEDAPAPEGSQTEGTGGPRVSSVSFTLAGEFQLTSVKVVKAGTSKALWHLVKAGTREPITTLTYGQNIKGMRPAPDCPLVQALEPNIKYELQLEAGRHRGRTTFEPREIPAGRAVN